MSKPLKEIPPETLKRWKSLSSQQPKKTKPERKPPLPNIPSTSKIPSLHLLRAEIENLRNAESPEKIHEVQARIDELHTKIMKESEGLREEAMRQVESLKQQRMMMAVAPQLMPVEKQYECPKCHRKWKQSQLNYSVKGKGKRKKKVPWCPHCNLQIFPEGE